LEAVQVIVRCVPMSTPGSRTRSQSGNSAPSMPYVRQLSVDQALLDAVDDGLNVLGENVRHLIYYHVGKEFHVSREEIPERLEAFHEALDSIFGAGAKIIERSIARSLYIRFGLSFKEHEDWTLVDHVNEVKDRQVQCLLLGLPEKRQGSTMATC